MGKIKHGGNIRAAADKYNIKKKNIIDFSSNINPIGLHKKIKKNIIQNIIKIKNYPDIEYKKLKDKISEYYNIPVNNLFPGNGSVSLIYLLVNVLKIKTGLIIQPNFIEYESALKSANIDIENIKGKEENCFKVPVEKIIYKIKPDMIVFLSNPNNPSGYLYSKKEMLRILEKCKKNNSYLFIDEAFLDFIKSYKKNTMIDFVNNNNLIILKSFTKNFAIPGLRLGFIAAKENIINKISDVSPPWSINVFAENIMSILLKLKKYFNKTRLFVLKEKDIVLKKLNDIPGIKVFDSAANYLLCKDLVEKSTSNLEEYLGKNGIIIRNCSNYKGLNKRFFRIAVRNEKENKILIKYLKKYFMRKL